MFRASMLAVLFAGLVVLSGGLVGQDPKKDEPPVKVKGVLPANWKKIGLTDDQVQKIYKVQNKYDDEIEKLQAKIDVAKTDRTKEMKAVLTADQKKRLDDILTGKEK